MKFLPVLCVVAACLAATPAHASDGIKYGIQDDAWLEFGPGDRPRDEVRIESVAAA